MIHLTRINRSELILNPDLIEHIQATPDTVITLTSGRNYLVLESPDEVIHRIVAFRQQIFGRFGTIRTVADSPAATASHGDPEFAR